jgi:hypothetical protein
MKIELSIHSTANAAFEGNEGPEVARMLRETADRIELEGGELSEEVYPLFDTNGNHVGSLSVSEESA